MRLQQAPAGWSFDRLALLNDLLDVAQAAFLLRQITAAAGLTADSGLTAARTDLEGQARAMLVALRDTP